MFSFATSRNLVIAAGLASAAFAFGAPAEAAQRSMFNCQGTRLQTFRCCKEYQPKPLWFRQQALNCEGVIRCEKKYCYVRQTWNPNYESKQKHRSGGENGKDGRGNQNGPNGKTAGGNSPN
ncbi:MAG: hypothetical protein HC855_01815 [Rhizobiales bacterium]|nr:hypothetical protein [Hyphomicrobiales bacterium]